MNPRVTVLIPTWNRAAFLRRALDSLCAQSLCEWQAIIIDDGSTDQTGAAVQPYLSDARFQYLRLEENQGLGAALNLGLQHVLSPLVAYLPDDDVYYRDHLCHLVEALEDHPEASLAYSGVRHHYNRAAPGQIEGYALQLVQVMHRLSDAWWVERNELVTDNLDRLYWSQMREKGTFLGTGEVTCEWVDHPGQLHKLLREPAGGINLFRQRFQITHPLHFHTSAGNHMDEREHYRRFNETPAPAPSPDGLKILIAGELAYNPERILALEERGHRLYGLWMREPYWYNTVGPLPFGHVQDIPFSNWKQAVREIQPDVIYALLNWQAVPLVHKVLLELPEIPLVWHFKEGPFICMEKGTWPQLLEIYARSSGHIYTSPEMRDWFDTILPGISNTTPNLVLDGDLPKREWFEGQPAPLRISEEDGELHTVVPGRPIGLHPADVAELAANQIHLHFYGNFTQGQWLEWIDKTNRLAPGYIHLHPTVDQENWLSEFSRYDAGWLHYFKSENQGEIRRANWDDLNYPARISTFMAAGLPLLQRDNPGAIVATQNLARSLGIGLFFDNFAALAEQLRDREWMDSVRAAVWRQREKFTFDYHADTLIHFLRLVIAEKHSRTAGRRISMNSLQMPVDGFQTEILPGDTLAVDLQPKTQG